MGIVREFFDYQKSDHGIRCANVMILYKLWYPLIKNSIVVIVLVTSISLAIFVKVFLSRVGKARAIILK